MTGIRVKERPKEPISGQSGRSVHIAEGLVLKDDTLHARWAWGDPKSKRSLARINNLKRLGYRVATAEDVADIQDAYNEPDGTIHRGDSILMVCDREAVEERDARAKRERESVERRQVGAIESGEKIETDTELHHQRVRGKRVDLV